MRTFIITLLLSIGLTTASTVYALDKGDIILRGGVGLIFPNDDSGQLTGVPGAEVGVDDSVTFAFTAGYMFHDNLAIELLGIYPANHEVEGEGVLPGIGISDVGDLDIFPPTLSLNYYFQPKQKLRPHVGVGVNYSVYWDTNASSQTKAVLGSGTDLDIDHSVGWAVNAGVDYDISDNMFFTANIWYVDIEAEATLKVPGTGELDIDVDVDPIVALIGLGFRF